MTTKLLPWSALVAVFIACMAMLLPSDDGTHSSFLCSVAVMLHSSILFFPLIAAVAAIDATYLSRSRSQHLIEALPPAARFRVAVGRGWRIALGACGGILAATVAAGTIAMANGSRLSWGVWPYLLNAIAGVVAQVCLGWAVGIAVKSWFVPPLTIIVFYGGAALNLSYIGIPSGFLSSLWTPQPALFQPSWQLNLWCLGVQVLIALAGLAGWLAWSRRDRFSIALLAVACSVLVVYCVSLVHGWLGASAEDEPVDTSHWVCQSLPSGGSVCVPGERPQDLPGLANELDPVNARLLMLDPELQTRVWRAVDNPQGTSLVYKLPLGKPVSQSEHAVVAAGELFTECLLAALYAGDDARAVAISESAAVVGAWIDPAAGQTLTDPAGQSRSITLAEAEAAYQESLRC